MRQREALREEPADADLAALAAAGDLAAFGELYRRHVEVAWRMALAVTANPHDAADAVSDAFTGVFQALPARPLAGGHFLPYLLAAVRNAAIDGLRRRGRQRPVNPGDHPERASLGAEPGDRLVADVEATLVAEAFGSLPERWRSVLWLTEVEKIPAREVATLLGISPNGVAQLAVRARAGLRQRYLQAHLGQSEVRHLCRDTVRRLGAYAAGGLAPRDIAKVDQHLAGCEPCRSRLTQLQDVTPSLYRAVLPLPVALGALSAAKFHLFAGGGATADIAAASTAAVAPASVGVGTVGVGAVAVAAMPAPFLVTMASATLLVAGFVGAGVVEHRQPRAPAPTAPIAAGPAPSASFATAASPASPAGGGAGEATGQLVDPTAAPDSTLAAIADLVASVGPDLSHLPAPPTLAALGGGGVNVDVGTAGAAVDLRDGAAACLLGVHSGCRGVAAPVVPIEVPPAATAADPLAGGVPATGAAGDVGAAGAVVVQRTAAVAPPAPPGS